MKRLQIGAGRRAGRAGDWTTIDADPRCGATYIATVPPLPKDVQEQGWHEIEMIHFIEHLLPQDAAQLLRECYECLLPGGVLILEQPNINRCAEAVLGESSGVSVGEAMLGLFGDPDKPPQFWGHRWGYTPQSLCDALLSAGFEFAKIEIKGATKHRPKRDFRVEARK